MNKNTELKILHEKDNDELNAIKKNKIKKEKKKHDIKVLEEVLKNTPKTKKEMKLEMMNTYEERIKKQEQIIKKEELEEKQKKQENDYFKKNMVYNEFIENKYDINNNEEGNFRSIDDYLNNGLSEKENVVFKKFYDEEFEKLKLQEPKLKLSQMKNKILKLWKKSTLNPSNN